MKLLLLDTSSKYLTLAVARNDKILASSHTLLHRKLSEKIIPAVSRVLKKTNFKIKDLDGYAVGLGPGSFTSLRVGLATIKGFSFATKKYVAGIPSLDIIAQGVVNQGFLQICVVLDARRNMYYSCVYNCFNKKIAIGSDYLLLPAKELFFKLKGDVLFVGDGIELLKKESLFPKKIKPHFADQKFWYPKAGNILPFALEYFRNERAVKAEKLLPLYLYPQDCQVNRKEKSIAISVKPGRDRS